ncbi:MAG: acyltransferase [Pseudomonadota bacterium]|nr:acyltransferase [Pseudomonadota bacterium]
MAVVRTRNLALDCLKLIMALAVVAIHTSPLILVWPQGNHLLTNGVCRIAVPTFFVISGFYLESALREPTALGTWWRRIVKLYVFWMLVYAPLYVTADGHSAARILATVVFGYLQLWYVAAMIVAAPLLHFAYARLSWPGLLRTACLLFAAGLAAQYVTLYSNVAEHHTAYRNAIFLAFPFMTFGVLIRAGLLDRLSARQRLLCFLLGMSGLAIEIAAGVAWGRPDVGIDVYASLVLICPFLFDHVRRIERTVATASIGILSSVVYFAHPLGIELSRWLLHRVVGGAVFCLTLAACLVLYYPLTWLSRRWTFVL